MTETVKKTTKKASPAPAVKAENQVANLKKVYKETIIPFLVKEFGYKNINEVPKIEKVIINMGLGDVKDNSKSYNIAFEELALIAGQRPVPTLAKKAISNFKLKEGMKIGAKVTLRGNNMYEFIERLISIALPRVRDFHGVNPKAFDGKGNYSLGIKEQIIFPEISYDKIEKIRGMDICFVTTAKTNAEALSLLKAIGMPFKR
ncbi:MAG: 50S ribosomal protein L5 [Clostridia bacterium]